MNHKDFLIKPDLPNITSQFKPAKNATIQAQLIDGGNPGGTVDFKDPWLIDDSDSKGTKNRGLNAIWHNQTSPFEVSTSNSSYKGVFLGENTQWDPLKPNYSVGAPNPNTFSIGGQNYQGYFINWEGSNVQYENASAAQTGVVFTNSGATATVKYKGHLISSLANATGSTTQRKIAAMNGIQYATYCSGGSVWFTKNDGTGWSAEKTVYLGTTARNSSIAVAYEAPYIAIHIVWDFDYVDIGQTTRRVGYMKSTDDGAHWTGRTLIYGEPAGTDIYPVVTASPSGAIAIWKYSAYPGGGLIAKPLPLLDGAVAPYTVLRGTGVNTGIPSVDNFKVVYNNNGNIMYDQIGIQNNAIAYSLAAPEVASVFQSGGSTPSVADVTAGNRAIVAWNVSSNIYLRERVGGVWQSAQYVTALGGSVQPPIASYDVDIDRYVVLWPSDSHIEKTSRPASGATWRTPINTRDGNVSFSVQRDQNRFGGILDSWRGCVL